MRTPSNLTIYSIVCLLGALTLAFASARVHAQDVSYDQADLIDRPVVRVEFTGLQRVTEQTVRNTVRTAAGNPYNPRTVQLDMVDLFRLGQFKTVTPRVRLEADGSVVVIFDLVEQPLLEDVQVVGNSLITDQELLAAIPLRPLVPGDESLIEESIRRIKTMYKDRGHYKAEVQVDQQLLEESNILLFQIIEGPRVRVRAIEFQFTDSRSFSDKQLKAQIRTEKAFFLLKKGPLDPNVITEDVAALDSFYKDRGYLDVRVDREWQLSPDDREAKVIFIINEGRVFTLRNVEVVPEVPNGPLVYSSEQAAALLAIKSGDVYSQNLIRESVEILQNSYYRNGYWDALVTPQEIRVGDAPEVDLRLVVRLGKSYLTGEVKVVGNDLTKEKVILRDLPIRPGRPLSRLDIDEAERRLRRMRLFGSINITPQDPDPEDELYRDLLIEIEETNTGSFNFGVAVGSDQGVFGDFSINQRNYDIADWPESFDEYIKGRAFRGAGQRFNLAIQPGNEVSQYSISITEPFLFDKPVSLTVGSFFRDRVFRKYDEERVNGSLALSQRFGQVWSAGVSTRFERVELSTIDSDAPTAVFDSAGPDVITAIGFNLTRNTTGTFVRPGRGSVLELGVEQIGLLGGDFSFTDLNGEYTVFLTLDEDFLGRRSILKLNTRVSYLLGGDDAPVYERYYLGGRTFRGFDFRTISPKGIRADNGKPSDEPVGGRWLFFAGAQYEFPIFEELFNGVVFMDTGTVEEDIGFDNYRVSVGAGIRLYIEAFGPVPLAFDFGFPVVKEPTDENQLLSFSVDIPF